MNRLTTAVLLTIALLAVSFQKPAQACGMNMQSAVAASCACCATIKSCLLPQKNPAPSAASAKSLAPAIALSAPVLLPLLVPEFAANPQPIERRTARVTAPSRARLALLCTYLI